MEAILDDVYNYNPVIIVITIWIEFVMIADEKGQLQWICTIEHLYYQISW